VSGDTVCQGMQTILGDTVHQVIHYVRGYSMSGDTVCQVKQCVRGCRLCQRI